MWGYLYDRSGEPVGARQGDYIYDMMGEPIGWIQGAHVYRLSGDYVGELYQDMVVDQWLSNPGSMGRIVSPGKIPPPDRPIGRGPMDYGYPDVFAKLLED
jgi:hypothetical protein